MDKVKERVEKGRSPTRAGKKQSVYSPELRLKAVKLGSVKSSV